MKAIAKAGDLSTGMFSALQGTPVVRGKCKANALRKLASATFLALDFFVVTGSRSMIGHRCVTHLYRKPLGSFSSLMRFSSSHRAQMQEPFADDKSFATNTRISANNTR